MNKINIMLNGIPGNVAANIARHVLSDSRFELIPYSLTGPEITKDRFRIDATDIQLIHPEKRDMIIKNIKADTGPFISVDYTHPTAVNSNGEFYCKNNLDFVMGTTGGDRHRLHQAVEESDIAAVIAPNMAKQIVGFQAMMEYAATNFPDLFKGYTLELKESHQNGKADTSGTARAMVSHFNGLGIPFSDSDIIMERNPEIQKSQWGIPEEHLKGHAYHTYTLTSEDNSVNFVFKHNINGREIYSNGTLDAVMYLHNQIQIGAKGKVFTMIDVLKGQ